MLWGGAWACGIGAKRAWFICVGCLSKERVWAWVSFVLCTA